jgi:hypothetical protein
MALPQGFWGGQRTEKSDGGQFLELEADLRLRAEVALC